MENPKTNIAWCRPCRVSMTLYDRTETGESFWCAGCGLVLEVSFDLSRIAVDKCHHKHNRWVPKNERL